MRSTYIKNPLWEVLDEVHSDKPGRYFRVACIHCGRAKVLSTSLINADKCKCPCRRSNRFNPDLSVYGRTQSVDDWLKEYPFVSRHSVRWRWRHRFQKNYADPQILFGPAGFPKLDKTPSKYIEPAKKAEERLQAQYTEALNEARETLARRVAQTVNAYFDDEGDEYITNLVRVIAPLAGTKPDNRFPLVAGSEYRLQVTSLTLAEHLETTGLWETIAMLQSEQYSSLDDKQARLSKFIRVDQSAPGYLSDMDINLLLSLNYKR